MIHLGAGATAGLGLDSLFHGNAVFGLGAKSDIADGSLRGFEFKKCVSRRVMPCTSLESSAVCVWLPWLCLVC